MNCYAAALRRELTRVAGEYDMSVTIRFCGAARTVTGSCYLFQTASGRFLVDCGLFQGQKTLKELNYGAFPFQPGRYRRRASDACAYRPQRAAAEAVREGFAGRILATRGTIDLCSYMLPDAGSIQELEVAALNRRNAARGRPAVTPIYTQADAIASLQSFRPVEYENWIEVIPGVRARYWNAGHLLGSASIELEFAGEGAVRPAAAIAGVRRYRPRREAAPARSGGPVGLRLRAFRNRLMATRDPRRDHARNSAANVLRPRFVMPRRPGAPC